MAEWHDYLWGQNPAEHSITGRLRVTRNVYSRHLRNRRDILVHLPPSYGQTARRYPVIYMQDGQNLFDRATSFAGEWEADETMDRLARETGLEAILVGVPNAGADRINEYSPFVDPEYGGGRADRYLNFLISTVKPMIDRDFLTLPDRANTGIFGSSMGALISLYAYLSRPDVFGCCGAMSGAFWFANKAILQYVKEADVPPPGRVYLDSGTGEKAEPPGSTLRGLARCFCDDVQAVAGTLVEKGYRPDIDVRYVQEIDGMHSEAVWARRLPGALQFLLG
jgi:predicted alpha/beta superfamily hydrolase